MRGRSKISAIIFDMDGLMFDTERLARRAWLKAMADWGCTVPGDLYASVIGKTASVVCALFREGLGRDLPIEAIACRKDAYLEEAFAREGLPLKEGLIELLNGLEAWGIRKAVASSTARDAVADRLQRAGLAHRFEVVMGGDETLRSKPEPDLFLAASQGLRVPASECLVLEDSVAGVLAGHAAGMVTVMIPDLVPPTEEVKRKADGILTSLREVLPFLKKRGSC